MELQLFQQMSDKLSQLSNQITIIQHYIHVKFGVDFQDYCYDRGINLSPLASTSRRKRRLRQSRRKMKHMKSTGAHLDPETGLFLGKPFIKTEPLEVAENNFYEIEDDSSESDENDTDENYEYSADDVMEVGANDEESLSEFGVEVAPDAGRSLPRKTFKAGGSSKFKKWAAKPKSTSNPGRSNQQESSDHSQNRKTGERGISACGRNNKDPIWSQFEHVEENTWKCKMCEWKNKYPKANRLRNHNSKCHGSNQQYSNSNQTSGAVQIIQQMQLNQNIVEDNNSEVLIP